MKGFIEVTTQTDKKVFVPLNVIECVEENINGTGGIHTLVSEEGRYRVFPMIPKETYSELKALIEEATA